MNTQEYEYQVEIDGINHGMDTLISGHIQQPLFDKFDVGLACCASLEVKYRYATSPQLGAKVVPRCRVKGSYDSWYQLGVFYVDVRNEYNGVRTLSCYDSMIFADVKFLTGSDPGEWPRNMKQVTEEIAARMGLQIDPRTVLNPTYVVDYPNEDSMRSILQYVAAAHAGNWIVTAENKLLLIPLFGSMPPETNYLVTEEGDPIVFGDDRILV